MLQHMLTLFLSIFNPLPHFFRSAYIAFKISICPYPNDLSGQHNKMSGDSKDESAKPNNLSGHFSYRVVSAYVFGALNIHEQLEQILEHFTAPYRRAFCRYDFRL